MTTLRPIAERLGPRVLVAEDNRITQLLLEQMLQRHGLRMDLASDGREAVRLARKGEYRLMIMDVYMPVMDGLAAIRAVRAHERDNHLRRAGVLVVSADESAESIELALTAGADRFMSKPLNIRDLDNVLTELADAQGAC